MRQRERKREGNNNDLSHVPPDRKEEIKSGTSGCGSFVVPYFPRPFTRTTQIISDVCFVTDYACCLRLLKLNQNRLNRAGTLSAFFFAFLFYFFNRGGS